MHSSVQVDASVLTDEELGDISQFLSNLPAVQDVTIAVMSFLDDGSGESPGFQAAAEPLFLTVSFLLKHWSQIAAGATEADAMIKAGVWLADQLNKCCTQRKAGYDPRPSFGGQGQVVTMVNVKKTI